MYSNDDATNLLGYLKQTPEGSLRQMLVSDKFTDAHFRLLMKLAKGGPEADFIDAFQNAHMGKLRLSPKEAPLRDNFWSICNAKFSAMGLIGKSAA